MKSKSTIAAMLAVALVAVAAMAYLLPVIVQQGTAQTAGEMPTVKVAYLPVVQSLPLFVAVEEGMFEKEGLKVELERIEAPNQIIDALVAGRVDAGAPSVAAGITAIVETKNPGALKVYSLSCGTIGVLNDELVASKDSELQSIADLRGKKLGHIPGVQFSTMAKKILMENGIAAEDVTLVELPVPNQLPTLEAKGVDAVLTLEPVGTIGKQKNTARVLVASPMVKYVADPWCGGAGVVSGKFLSEKPEAAEAFIKVMREAIEKTKENQAYRAYLVKYLNLPEAVANDVPLPLLISTQNIDPKVVEAYQKFADVFYELGVIEKQPDVRQLLLG